MPVENWIFWLYRHYFLLGPTRLYIFVLARLLVLISVFNVLTHSRPAENHCFLGACVTQFMYTSSRDFTVLLTFISALVLLIFHLLVFRAIGC